MRILITGAKGMLGSDLVKVFNDNEYEVVPCDVDNFDITDITATIKYIKANKPHIILHPAAYTDVDGCEANEDLAYRVNALGARNVAVACRELDIPMVYYSTDYIFDGTNSQGYKEFDQPNPLNVYGRTKLAGERFVQQILDKFYIVRISWLCGHNGKNFIKTILKLSQKRKELTIVNDQTGSPTFTIDVSQATLQLIQKPIYGIYHITNSDYCTWYQFAKEICQYAGVNVNIKPITTKEFNRPALRPEYSILNNYHWKLEGYRPLRSYKEALEEYLIKEMV
ncbi:MAG: dTDP-4-dehydrorhamnose reductase [Peptococcales bacterium]|jgi:dTDP-4-dehydrorhamnose reductase